MNPIDIALSIATKAHAGQLDEMAIQPFFIH